MRRVIARLRLLWLALVPVIVVGSALLRRGPLPDLPVWLILAGVLLAIALAFVPPPRHRGEAVELAPPVRGRWVSLNGPGSKVPSHATSHDGQRFAVDLVQPGTADTPPLVGPGMRGSRSEEYSCFGAPILAMAPGRVTRVVDSGRDHRARNTWPALAMMMSVEAIVRSLGGFRGIAGNHLIVDHGDGSWAAYAHLRHRSARVAVGDEVALGQELALVGNTGNTSEPHLHVQLMDPAHPGSSAGVPMRWTEIEVTEQLDPRLEKWLKPPPSSALDHHPADGVIFVASGPQGARDRS